MEDLGGPGGASRVLDSENFFLLAAVTQPQRHEAYLGLAQLNYAAGYIERGDYFARLAQAVYPSSYEAFCLLGQRFEDSGNYVGAMEEYSEGLRYYGFDAYLTERRYLAASSGGLQPQWFVRVPSGRGAPWMFLLPKYPDFYLLNEYRREAGKVSEVGRHYALPIFTFGYCPEEKPVSERLAGDLYEDFVMSSLDNPAQYAAVRGNIDKIRKEALDAVSKVTGVKEKAKALYMWLKANVLKDYDQRDGVRVQDLIEKKKYVSLNASLLYTLIAREAGLPVRGIVGIGHAWASVDDGKRDIPIELIAEARLGLPQDQGFDVVWWDQFKLLNRSDVGPEPGLRDSKYRTTALIGPAELTGYQFFNVEAYNLDHLIGGFKEEMEHKKTLEDMIIQINRESAVRLESIKARYRRDPEEMERLLERTRERSLGETRKLQREIQAIVTRMEKEKAAYIEDKGLDLIKKARALAPGSEEFLRRHAEAYDLLAFVDILQVKDSAQDRRMRKKELEKLLTDRLTDLEITRRLSGAGSVAAEGIGLEIKRIRDAITSIDVDESRNWETEKAAWLTAINRLDRSVRELPCSERLKRRLESFCWTAVNMAQGHADAVTVDQVVAIGVSRLPTSDFARRYRGERVRGM
jgi:hypothetical protein